jgi:hypothetical protein
MELFIAELRAREQDALAAVGVTRGRGADASIRERHQRRMDGLKSLLEERIRLEKDVPLAPDDEATWYVELVSNLESLLGDHGERLHREASEDWSRLVKFDISRYPESGSEEQIREWVQRERKIEDSIFARDHNDRLTGWYSRRCRFLDKAVDDCLALVEPYRLKAEIMQAEREHQRRVPVVSSTQPHITLNINHSQVAGLNVAGAVGTIQATVNTLQTAGQEKIAEALKALTEAIAAESSLTPEARRESLELVSGIGEELELPEDQRRPGVFRSLGQGLKKVLGQAGNLKALYEMVQSAAKAAGYELP